MTSVIPTRTASSDLLPVVTPPEPMEAGFTLSERTISGLEHDITELLQELEQLGVDLVSRPRK